MEIDCSILKDTAIFVIGLSSGWWFMDLIDYLRRKRYEREETRR